MIISEKYNFVFIGTPKCATNTMYEIIEKHYGGVRYGPFHHNRIPDRHKDKFVWTIVRNPYARAISIWWSAVVRPEKGEDPYGARKALRSLKFGDFTEWLANTKQNNPLFMPQSQWIGSVNAENVKCIKLESLNYDFWALPFNDMEKAKEQILDELIKIFKLYKSIMAYRIRGGLPIRNASSDYPPNKGYGEWWKYYIATPMAALRVIRWAKEDFRKYGYKTYEGL